MTCGGLCPGLNDVVQGLVSKLTDYGVPEGNVVGIRCAPATCPALPCLPARRLGVMPLPACLPGSS